MKAMKTKKPMKAMKTKKDQKPMKAMKAMRTKKDQKPMKATKAKPLTKRPAGKKDSAKFREGEEVRPEPDLVMWGQYEVGLVRDGELQCFMSVTGEESLHEVLQHAIEDTCDKVQYKAMHIRVHMSTKQSGESDNLLPKKDDKAADDDGGAKDDGQQSDVSGNSDNTGTSSSHYWAQRGL